MKKLKTAVSVLSVLGLGALAAISAPKNYSLTKDTDEKVYMVSVKGDIVNDNAAAVKNRKEVVNELNYKLAGKGYTITHTYDTVFNGFAIKTTANIADIVKSLQGVRSVEEEHTYSRPEVVDPSDPVSTGTVLGDKLQNFSAQSMKATAAHVNAVIAANGGTGTSQGGKGVLIGIADTGLYLNQVAGTDARTAAETAATTAKKTLNDPAFQPLTDTSADVFTQAKLDAVKGSLTTGKTAVRINSKIAYAYDYADGDNNVDPSKGTADNVHGTHVASLASANGTAFQGIAPNAQLAIFKVFPDNSSGASDSSIEAALEDATKLGVDTLNFSLGTDLTESGDTTSDATNMAIKAAKDKGVIVNFSAGNAGKFEMKQNSADYVDGADCLVFDQGARDDTLGHGANGQGVKFVADTTDIKGDTYDGMQDIVVNYRKATTTTSTTAKTIYFKGYVAVPANMDKVINFKEATIAAADDADLTADKITKVTGYNYYRLNTVASGNDNADTAPVYTITNDMFVYDTAVVDTSTKAGYDTVKADFDLDKNLTVGFTFVANYVND